MTRILKFGTKLALVGASVYYTNELGIWKDSVATEKIYKEAYSMAAPYVKEIPIEVPELPKVENLATSAKNMWNHGVFSFAGFLTELPEHIVSLSKTGTNFVISLFEDSGSSKTQ